MFKNNEMTPLSGGKGVANIHYTRGENNIGAPKTGNILLVHKIVKFLQYCDTNFSLFLNVPH